MKDLIVNNLQDLALTKPPKVRVADCPCCAEVTVIQRKARGEEIHTSVCVHCLCVFQVTNSRLINYEN